MLNIIVQIITNQRVAVTTLHIMPKHGAVPGGKVQKLHNFAWILAQNQNIPIKFILSREIHCTLNSLMIIVTQF